MGLQLLTKDVCQQDNFVVRKKNGAQWDRTSNLEINVRQLYQLSYIVAHKRYSILCEKMHGDETRHSEGFTLTHLERKSCSDENLRLKLYFHKKANCVSRADKL